MNGFGNVETCIDLCLYIFPLIYFILFIIIIIICLKELSNVNLKMKRDIELQKSVAHTSIWLGKRESDLK